MVKWLAITALLWAAIASPAAADTPPDPAEAAIHAFANMRNGWNAGDIEAALSAYWDSPDITWVNRSGVSHGLAEFAEEMRARFADAPETMGVYTAEILDARTLTPDSALIVARWDISLGEERLFGGGVSTMLWRRIDGEWKIVLEHAS